MRIPPGFSLYVACMLGRFIRFDIHPSMGERRALSADGADPTRVDDLGIRHFSSAATLSMPALAQASSLSPPGAPETPTAPITSSPTLMGSAPRAGTMLVRNSAPAVGLFLTASANSPDGRRMV